MSAQRCRVEIGITGAPVSGLQSLLLTEEALGRLLSDGGPDVSPDELTRIRAIVPSTRFQAKAGQTLAINDGDRCLWLIGRGKGGTRTARRAAATAVSLIPDGKPWSLRLGALISDEEESNLLRAAVEGIQLGTYRYKQSAKPDRDEGLRPGPCQVVASCGDAAAVAARAESMCEAMLLARDLINMPAADLGPEELASAAEEVAQRHAMQATILRGDDVAAQGFRMVEAVGRASARSATVTIVRVGDPSAVPAIALIGKGVVFDSGGLDIKNAAGMLLMRKDMGGAGTVIGVLDAIGRLGVDVPLLAVLPAAENAVGSRSFRPGDILHAYNRLTVQIGNTDAEGRLLLGDALAYAVEQGAERMIDLATLTGSARQALGPDLPALFGTDDKIVDALLARGIANDEPLWRMPLVDDYETYIDSPHADMSNISSEPRGGSITAALFLRRFVGDTPWSHIDMYGWEDSGKPEAPKGANGAMVRSVAEVVAGLQ